MPLVQGCRQRCTQCVSTVVYLILTVFYMHVDSDAPHAFCRLQCTTCRPRCTTCRPPCTSCQFSLYLMSTLIGNCIDFIVPHVDNSVPHSDAFVPHINRIVPDVDRIVPHVDRIETHFDREDIIPIFSTSTMCPTNCSSGQPSQVIPGCRCPPSPLSLVRTAMQKGQ